MNKEVIDYKSAYENVLIANNMLRKENKELHNKIDKAIDKLNFYKNTEWGLRSLSILETFEEILKDSDVDE